MTERRIVALNNSGVNALRCGRLCEAVLSFRHAMQCLKNIAMAERHQRDMQDLKNPTSPCPSPLGCLFDVDLSAISPSNMFEVYPCAFALPKNTAVTLYASETLIVLAYNLALANHLTGLFMPNQGHYLTDALHYYSLALTAARPQVLDKITYQTLVLLGCANNMGHVHAHNWKIAEAKACYDFMDGILSRVPEDDQLLQQEDDFFFTVLAYGAAHTYHFAPAA